MSTPDRRRRPADLDEMLVFAEDRQPPCPVDGCGRPVEVLIDRGVYTAARDLRIITTAEPCGHDVTDHAQALSACHAGTEDDSTV